MQRDMLSTSEQMGAVVEELNEPSQRVVCNTFNLDWLETGSKEALQSHMLSSNVTDWWVMHISCSVMHMFVKRPKLNQVMPT